MTTFPYGTILADPDDGMRYMVLAPRISPRFPGTWLTLLMLTDAPGPGKMKAGELTRAGPYWLQRRAVVVVL